MHGLPYPRSRFQRECGVLELRICVAAAPRAAREAKPKVKGQAMKTEKRMALVALFAAATMTAGFAQAPGADTYKAKCQSCHGAQGMPNPGIAKAMGVKPANDPSVTSIGEAQMIADTTNGKGKMPAFKGKLSDVEIKSSVEYFRSLGK